MLKPDGRVIMISGANRGIGLAIAKNLAQAGYQLSLGARNPSSIDTAALNAANAAIMTHHWDATEVQSSTAWAQATLDRYQRIDGVVLNAGQVMRAGLEQGSEDDMDTMWEVNFKGPLRLMRAVLPALKASGHGRVVNIVSLGGKRLLSDANLGYSASKFAVMALNNAIRRNGWDSGIRATAICPGLVDTDMVADVDAPDGEFKIAPATIAATAAYALSLPNEASVAEMLVNSRFEASF